MKHVVSDVESGLIIDENVTEETRIGLDLSLECNGSRKVWGTEVRFSGARLDGK